MDRSRGFDTSRRHGDFTAPRSGVTAGTLAFTRGARGVDICAGQTSDRLFTARFQGRHPKVSVTGKSTVEVHYRLGPHRTQGLIQLNPAVEWTIQIWDGASHFHADLTGLVLASISIDGGASDVTLRLPEPSARVPVRIRRGASQVKILRPPGVPTGLDVRKGASQLVFDDQWFGALGGDIQLRSAVGNGSSGRYDIDVGGGASRLSVGIAPPATLSRPGRRATPPEGPMPSPRRSPRGGTMDTASTISSSTLDATLRSRSALQVAAIGALAATVANVALWAGGRAADVGFLVSPPAGDTVTQVGVVQVVLTTLLTFAVGSAVLALAVRRSNRWVRVVMAAAAVVAIVSAAGGPPLAAHDTATGALLAAMHLVTGAAFVATAARVRAR